MASSEKEATTGRMLMASPSLLKLAPRLQAGVRNSHSRWSAAKIETSRVGITPISQNKHRGCSQVGYDFAEVELDPKVCFIEIGAVGSSIDQATADRVQAAAVQATHDTGKPKAKTPPLVKRSFFVSYIDDIAGYTIQKPRHTAQTYWVASNHLFSPAAVTNSTGQVLTRYTYDTFGKQTIRNAMGDMVYIDYLFNNHGFTGRAIDEETGLNYFRNRLFSTKLGRYISRNDWGMRIGSNYSVSFGKLSQPTLVNRATLSPRMRYWDSYSLYSITGLGINVIDPSGEPGSELELVDNIGNQYQLSEEGKERLHDLMAEEKAKMGLGANGQLDKAKIRELAKGIKEDGGKYLADHWKNKRRSKGGYSNIWLLMMGMGLTVGTLNECCDVKTIKQSLFVFLTMTDEREKERGPLASSLSNCLGGLAAPAILRGLEKMEESYDNLPDSENE